ncbi:hypothetical protein [Pelomonas sp. Root1237]|uniref:hypothetical protein n=1 Tax=Pelomonas sp. Root1237 TaxID=1736434 RepID=UPI0006F5080D|nr:hypothetical protein [Pelomonas sp. Root1237]KQV88239.1 hypothetical protein ASC91_15600 [Pelomonas sp. Root1237]
MKPHRLLAPLLAWAALASCAQTPPPAPTTPAASAAAETESVRLGRELRALIGPAACKADAQCRTIAVGAKACGGPAGYLAWSSESTDAQRLAEIATRQAQAHKREIEASGMLSNCAMVADPGAACVAGRCQLATPASAR